MVWEVKKPGRALIISSRLGPVPDEGGVRVYTRYLARALVGLGERVTIVAARELPHREQRRVDLKPAYNVIRHKPYPLRKVTQEHIANAYQVLAPRIRTCDYVLINRLERATLPAILDLCEKYDKPFYPLFHSRANVTTPFFVEREDRDRAFKQAGGILAVSDHLAETILEATGYKAGVLANGIDLAEIDYFMTNAPSLKVRRVYKHFDRRPTILTLSRIAPHKGQDLMIQAMPHILKDIDAHYVLAGADECNGKHKRMVEELGLERSVSFLGVLQGTEKWTAYYKSDVFAMPSASEGNPLVYAEARGFCKPIIVSDMKAGGRHAVEHGIDGLRVNRDDVPGIAKALVSLLEDKDYARKLGLEGRKRVQGRSWSVVAGDFLAMIGR